MGASNASCNFTCQSFDGHHIPSIYRDVQGLILAPTSLENKFMLDTDENCSKFNSLI
jgi:hypothetical protein